MVSIYKRYCNNCSKYYEGFGKKFCSRKCRSVSEKDILKRYANKGRKIRWEKSERGRYIECKLCGMERWEYPYILKKEGGKFCSQKCSNLYNANKLSEQRKGKGNPAYGKRPWNYIDGTKSHYYTKLEWKVIANKIRLRDKKICQKCGKFGYIVHHKIPRRWGGSDDPENLEVLCHQCHAKEHVQLKLEVMSYGYSQET